MERYSESLKRGDGQDEAHHRAVRTEDTNSYYGWNSYKHAHRIRTWLEFVQARAQDTYVSFFCYYVAETR